MCAPFSAQKRFADSFASANFFAPDKTARQVSVARLHNFFLLDSPFAILRFDKIDFSFSKLFFRSASAVQYGWTVHSFTTRHIAPKHRPHDTADLAGGVASYARICHRQV